MNDALMAVFFFVVGLEIKRELVSGAVGVAALARGPKAAESQRLAAASTA